MNDIYSIITTRSQVEEFCHKVFFDLKINVHPDDDFNSYVDVNSGEKEFEGDEGDAFNLRFAECLDVLGEEVYDICCEQLKQALLG